MAHAQYSNIASQSWGTQTSPNTRGSYIYSYDAINRLQSGITANSRFSESGIKYDLGINITALQRTWNSTTFMDNLQYIYAGGGNYSDQVQSINDLSADANIVNGYKTGSHSYLYDANGNMTSDASKGLAISYNLLNLPQTNTMTGGTITYVYDAAGRN